MLSTADRESGDKRPTAYDNLRSNLTLIRTCGVCNLAAMCETGKLLNPDAEPSLLAPSKVVK
jgi:hypothetical protein